jgi:ABC-type phosphate transport system substrate-binding protein
MKKLIAAATVALGVGLMAAPAMADYGTQPGFAQSTSQTDCSGAGAFGAFGANGDVSHDFGVNNPGSNEAPGADGTQTGINNSTLCGQPDN